ncbi:MAG: hypothetical protein WA086_07100, partial [Ideonella sp.]
MLPLPGFEAACQRTPDAVALEIADAQWTYAQIADWSGRLRGLLAEVLPADPAGTAVAVFASRSLTA